jgi:peptide/nickel transport system substrate-binding protein
MTNLWKWALAGAIGVGVSAAAVAQEARRGGAINVATIGEPPTLDPSVSTTDVTGMISLHYFETLYTFGADWRIVPLLAASQPTISPDGKTYTIPLRTGVKFHDGSTMSSADVLASLKRWMEVAVRGKQAGAFIEGIAAPDANTIRIQLKEPYAPLLALLSLPTSAAIIVPAAKATPQLSDIVGTGPFRFKERQPDRYVLLTRFDEYTPRMDDAQVYGGKRTAYLDEIRFVPVPNANTRVEGALSGQYHYADSLPVESFKSLQAQSKTQPVVLAPFGWPVLVLNTRQGAVTNMAVRQAIQMALKPSDMLEAAFGDQAFFKADGSLYPEGFIWHSKNGVEVYNQGNAAKARELAKSGGYAGQPIRILTTQQFEFHFRMAQVAAEYLKQAGFTVDLQVSDWATLTQRRGDPALWEGFFTHSPFLPEPALNGYLNDASPGWWSSPARNRLVQAFNQESDPVKRAAIFADLQKVVLTEVPIIKIGNFNALAARSPDLQGLTPAAWPFFWNVSLKR